MDASALRRCERAGRCVEYGDPPYRQIGCFTAERDPADPLPIDPKWTPSRPVPRRDIVGFANPEHGLMVDYDDQLSLRAVVRYLPLVRVQTQIISPVDSQNEADVHRFMIFFAIIGSHAKTYVFDRTMTQV